jgi:proline-specific peptidase
MSLRSDEGYIAVEGGQVWRGVLGDGPRTPLLLLHGGPGAPSYYMNPLGALADERPVVFYDQLGSGRSDKPNDANLWRIERFVDEVDAVRDALGLDEIHLLGHSWGGMLAVEYMRTGPDHVRSLILASPCLSVSRWLEDAEALRATLPPEMQSAIARHEAAASYDAPEYQEAVTEYYKRYMCRRDPWPEEVQRGFAELNLQLYTAMWGPSEFTATGSLRTFERTEALRELRLPILFTGGRFDEATPATLEYYRSLAPAAELEILEHSAHLTMQDEPEKNVEIIRAFLQRVETSALPSP